jgi:hypothetical protein
MEDTICFSDDNFSRKYNTLWMSGPTQNDQYRFPGPYKQRQSASENFEQRPQALLDKADILKQQGHICVHIVGSSNLTLDWCEQEDVCATQLQKEAIKHRDFAKNLKARGHTCIGWSQSPWFTSRGERFPSAPVWCEQPICTKRN